MANPAKDKGSQAEREAAAIIADLTGWPAKRKLGAGRAEDCGDIYGVPDCVVQVAWWPKKGVLRACREKPLEAEQQRLNDGATFAASFIRFHGGDFRVVLTPAQWATLMREATA